MAKCSNCGKSGLFLKLENGLCNDCVAIAHRRHENELLSQERSNLQQQIADAKIVLEKTESSFNAIVAQAKADGSAQALQLIEEERKSADLHLAELAAQVESMQASLAAYQAEEEKASKKAAAAIRKVEKLHSLLSKIEHVTLSYQYGNFDADKIEEVIAEANEYISPTVILDLQCLSMKELRKRYRQNEKVIEETLQKFASRYTTKTIATIYKLMVIALRAELQNVLYNLSYGRLEDALASITEITEKYFTLAAGGSQSIASTLRKFITEIDYLFQEAVKIEYEYYVQKERAKEEQRAIREQMRQEAEERRALELEKKKIEKEENKFHEQISKIEEQLKDNADSEKISQLDARLAELQAQLSAVVEKKDVITTLQNGKAGNVYVISNLGSFGDHVFKIGMTRRAEPQERINELGDASVPFPFDVHSFIFSDDAAALEHQIHSILNDRRVNKVNLRKEFFDISLDELEQLVQELAPTAEFKRTMLAEQYRQSQSIDKIVDSITDDIDDSEEE